MGDSKNGKGCMQYANQDIFVGMWSANEANGFGIFISKNQTRYEGLFSKGLR